MDGTNPLERGLVVMVSAAGVVSRLVLWDIDGTLVRAGDVGAAVFDRAVERVVGLRPRRRVKMSGKTDPQIVAEYLAMLEVTEPAELGEAILVELEKELAAAEEEIRSGGRVLPGVVEALTSLGGREAVLQSIVTGNIAPNALLKLAAFGLEGLVDLEVGAFGSDHADRNELVPIALERIGTKRGRRFSPSAVWVVGDSPNDLACARAAGVRCLLVATGRSSVEDLARLRPDAVMEDLSATDDVVRLLVS